MVAPPRIPARVTTVRRQFDARAARFGERAALPREVGRRLIERLQYIRLVPHRILDVGCGAGETCAPLVMQYPRADWIGLDISERMLKAAKKTDGMRGRAVRWLRGASSHRVAGDGGRLPIADDSVDLVFSNLMLHWHPEPHTVFPEWKRVLRADGLLMFSCFGPDTLKELRTAAEALSDVRAMPFVDMHDFGDMMVASGFSTPVMDAEVITLTYASPQDLLREVRALGGNPRDDRAQSLPSGRQARQMLGALDAQRGQDGRIRLTFEVAYGHAWKPKPNSGSVTAITVETLRAELASRRARQT
jgi:malonyl-CoA O-methyltransferase